MVDWLKLILIAAAVMVALWGLLVVLAARLPASLLKDLAGFLPACVTLVRRLRVDPRVPFKAKAAVVLAGLWVLSPIDLLPEFLPVIGPLDDVVVVAMALRYAARRVPARCSLRPGPGSRGCWSGWSAPQHRPRIRASRRPHAMSLAHSDEQRTRFRRPIGVAVMAYKAALGLSELLVGVLLAVPSFDPQATFARLSAEELREDPDDRFIALIGRHLPALLHHRGLVAVGLITLGLAKLVAAAAMWEGHEWGGYLLAATVALLLPFDLRQAVVDPSLGHVLLAVANAAALVVLVLLLRGWLPGRPLLARPTAARAGAPVAMSAMGELDDFLNETLARQVKAEEALHNGDPAPRLAMWSTQDPVTVLGAMKDVIGAEEARQVFGWLGDHFSDCTSYRFELVAAGVSGDLAYTVGYEHTSVSWDGGPVAPYTLRVTHAYRREQGEWKIVHRHADRPPIDQGPPAEASAG